MIDLKKIILNVLKEENMASLKLHIDKLFFRDNALVIIARDNNTKALNGNEISSIHSLTSHEILTKKDLDTVKIIADKLKNNNIFHLNLNENELIEFIENINMLFNVDNEYSIVIVI